MTGRNHINRVVYLDDSSCFFVFARQMCESVLFCFYGNSWTVMEICRRTEMEEILTKYEIKMQSRYSEGAEDVSTLFCFVALFFCVRARQNPFSSPVIYACEEDPSGSQHLREVYVGHTSKICVLISLYNFCPKHFPLRRTFSELLSRSARRNTCRSSCEVSGIVRF